MENIDTELLWECLKLQCCATKPHDPKWKDVGSCVMVSKVNIKNAVKLYKEKQECK